MSSFIGYIHSTNVYFFTSNIGNKKGTRRDRASTFIDFPVEGEAQNQTRNYIHIVTYMASLENHKFIVIKRPYKLP